jgi:DNA-binding NarL/FixJ family response regulator
VPNTPQIRVLIADDHSLFAEALGLALEADPRLEVVGVARDGLEVIDLARGLEPDVILMDLDMPLLDGVAATQKLLKASPARVAILSASTSTEDARQARDAGASAFLTKGCSTAEVIETVLELGAPETFRLGPGPLQFRGTVTH